MTVPTIDALYWVPRGEVEPGLLREATAVSAFDEDGEEIQAWEERDGLIGLPRSLARTRLKPAEVKWAFARGHDIDVPKCPTPRNADQRKFFEQTLEACRTRTDTVAHADTGVGKTVCACWCIWHLRKTTLIVVHLGGLVTQWREQLAMHCGFSDDEIGQVGDGRKDWEGKKVVVAYLQSLRRDTMPPEFWDHFGFSVFDECHKAPAAKSSLVLRRLKSARRLGLTATFTRRDRLDKLVSVHLGPIRVRCELSPMPVAVHAMHYDNPVPWSRVYDPEVGEKVLKQCWPVKYRQNEWGVWEVDAMATRGAVQDCLAKDPVRKALLLGILLKAAKDGRRGIVVADKIEHLEDLKFAAMERGLDEAETGMFTGEATMEAREWIHEEVPISDRRRENEAKRKGIPFAETKATERKVKVDANGEKMFRIVRKRKSQDEDALDDIKKGKRIVFATYGKLTEGIDQPAWDWGMDITGRSTAKQLLGRIRREMPGKVGPVWHTVVDDNCPMAFGWYRGRLNDYHTLAGCTVREFVKEEGRWTAL